MVLYNQSFCFWFFRFGIKASQNPA